MEVSIGHLSNLCAVNFLFKSVNHAYKLVSLNIIMYLDIFCLLCLILLFISIAEFKLENKFSFVIMIAGFVSEYQKSMFPSAVRMKALSAIGEDDNIIPKGEFSFLQINTITSMNHIQKQPIK